MAIAERRAGVGAPHHSPGPEWEGRRSYARTRVPLALPHLLEVQLDSWDWFLGEGIREVFRDLAPVADPGGRLRLRWGDPRWGEPRRGEAECRALGLTYSAPLSATVELEDRETGEVRVQAVHLAQIPMMTPKATFVLGGSERVVVAQLVRSPGVYFRFAEAPDGRRLWGARLIPANGAWIEMLTSARGPVYARLGRQRRLPATLLLRAVAALDPGVVFGAHEPGSDRWLLEALGPHDAAGHLGFTLEEDPMTNGEAALRELYRRMHPGEPLTRGGPAGELRRLLFESPRHYDLGIVGRSKTTAKWQLLDLPVDRRALEEGCRGLFGQDVLNLLARVLWLQGHGASERPHETDDLANKRVRGVGELLANHVRVGLVRMERQIAERLAEADQCRATPLDVVNPGPFVAAVREFFGGHQLSQFLDQVNVLSEVSHKRRLSSLGPGGLSRYSASMDARDVHRSHYGRICPIESPEGANIGLIGQLACYARVNPFGFIETPYRRVVSEVEATDPERLEGHVLREPISVGGRSVPPGTPIDGPLARALCRELPGARVLVAARATGEVEYLDAEREALYTIAQANSALDGEGRFLEKRVEARSAGDFVIVPPARCRYMDASPTQVVGTGASLIPFLAHDDANRALMAANMMRQAVPLLTPEAPLVGTGMEGPIARDSGHVVVAQADGTVVSVTAGRAVVAEPGTRAAGGGRTREYELAKWTRSNDGTLLSQRPAVSSGQRVSAGQVIADSLSTDKGELALGKNVLVAYLSWGGYNFEDGIVVSERLVRDDVYTSVHIEQFECAVRDTHLGPEQLTREIPNASDESLSYLDERGIVRVGARVVPGDILVGKVSPKGEAGDLAPEERLLWAILGERERGARDTSMRAPVGVSGTVMSVLVLSRARGDELPPNVIELVRVLVAKKHKLRVGDKMAGRHGNKGVVATVVPVEDMPYTADGRVIDICLSPLGVPSRMNLGQLLETRLGHACEVLGIEVATPVFDGATEADIREARSRACLPEDGKLQLFDGRTGEPFDQRTTVGVKYVMKLHHLVEKKVHARSTGPYSLVTQQPLGGRALGGGQRMGEMEVWALEAYGAAKVLREMLTVKSDDVEGRLATYHALTRGLPLPEEGTPESFKLLAKELAALGLSIEALEAEGQCIPLTAAGADRDLPRLEVNISRKERGLDEEARR